MIGVAPYFCQQSPPTAAFHRADRRILNGTSTGRRPRLRVKNPAHYSRAICPGFCEGSLSSLQIGARPRHGLRLQYGSDRNPRHALEQDGAVALVLRAATACPMRCGQVGGSGTATSSTNGNREGLPDRYPPPSSTGHPALGEVKRAPEATAAA